MVKCVINSTQKQCDQLKRGVLPASGLLDLMRMRDVGNAAYTALTTDTCDQVTMQSRQDF